MNDESKMANYSARKPLIDLNDSRKSVSSNESASLGGNHTSLISPTDFRTNPVKKGPRVYQTSPMDWRISIAEPTSMEKPSISKQFTYGIKILENKAYLNGMQLLSEGVDIGKSYSFILAVAICELCGVFGFIICLVLENNWSNWLGSLTGLGLILLQYVLAKRNVVVQKRLQNFAAASSLL